MPWTELPATGVGSGANFRINDITFAGDRRWAAANNGVVLQWKAGGSPTASAVPRAGHLRCIGFDPTGQVGWIGRYLPSNQAPLPRLLKTVNGGETWEERDEASLPVDPAEGLCGISVLATELAFACGTFKNATQAGVWRTTDGERWTPLNLPVRATGLTDVKFWGPEQGLLVGQRAHPANAAQGHPLILTTTNGGQSWRVATLQGAFPEGSHCWKIHRVDASIAYVTVAGTGSSTESLLKTEDGGLNWRAVTVDAPNSGVSEWDLQGVGFVDAQRGWVGQRKGFTFETTNGGNSWTVDRTLSNLNRFAFTPEGPYAVGAALYRYT